MHAFRPLIALQRLSYVVSTALLVLVAVLMSGCGSNKNEASFDEQVRSAKKLKRPMDRGQKLISISYKQQKAGDLSGAIRSASTAAREAEQINNATQKASLLNRAAYALGTFQASEGLQSACDKVVETIDKIEPKADQAAQMAKLAEITSLFLKKEENSKSLFEDAEKIALEASQPNELMRNLAPVIYYHNRLKHDAEVTRILAIAEEKGKAFEDPKDQARAFLTLAEGLNKGKMAEEAAKQFTQANTIIKSIKDPHAQGYSYLELGKALKKASKASDADQAFRNAQTSAKKIKDAGISKSLQSEIQTARR